MDWWIDNGIPGGTFFINICHSSKTHLFVPSCIQSFSHPTHMVVTGHLLSARHNELGAEGILVPALMGLQFSQRETV